ncbi:hypothetical protein JTB14_022981 [Gonioctena quinquepunctata]|nr:hypothetical protein JTB14_022981 [Gonioctena quinquepunctata]
MEYVDGTKTNVETDFQAKNKRALAAIVSGVKTHIHTEIRDLKTAGPDKYNECECMDDYLSKKVKLAQQLKAIDHEIEDGVSAALIFVSISGYYKPLILAMQNCGVQLTTDLVGEHLSAEAVKF